MSDQPIQQPLIIFAFEFYHEYTPDGRPVPMLRFKCRYPSGMQADPTWPADAEDMEFITDLRDRYAPKIFAMGDPDMTPEFTGDSTENGFRPDKEQ